jgi:hypothetical protein
MKKMLAILTFAALAATTATAGELVNGPKFGLDAHGRLQWLAVGQSMDDSFRDDNRLYLFMKQARLSFNGRYDETRFDVQLAYGGENVVGSNVSLGLLDFSFDVPIPATKLARVKVGQFRVPYGRERLTDSGTLNFGDRSIQSLGFSWNRDVGVALHSVRGRFAGTAGVFTAGGRDVPQRYIPEKLGSPMFVARLGYNDGIDRDVYTVRDRGPRPEKREMAFYVNGLYVKDSLIGHSTVLNVKATDKSLLLNGNWNPFIAKTPLIQGKVWQAGGDGVLRMPVGSFTVNAEVEANYAKFENDYGTLAIHGGRLQVGVGKGSLNANVRYSVLHPDTKMANTFAATGQPTRNYPITVNDQPMREITPSLTWNYKSNVAFVMDLPILVDMIVFQENNLGTYVATEHPDQASYARPGAGTAMRQTVKEGRLLVQMTF